MGMSLLDWAQALVGAPRCADLAALVQTVRDPVAFLSADSFRARGDGVIYPGLPYHFNSDGDVADAAVRNAALPYSVPVARNAMTPTEAQAVARLLLAYYKTPAVVRSCPVAVAWAYPEGRARAFASLGFYLANVATVDAATAAVVRDAFVAALDGTAVDSVTAYAAARAVAGAVVPVLDAATWIPLWRWAADSRAAVGTRVVAMQALTAIIRRGSLLPAQVRAAATLADVVRALVVARAPTLPAASRELFIAEAQALLGFVNDALSNAAAPTPPRPPKARPWSGWWVVAGAAGAVAVVGAAVYHRRHA